MSVFGLLLVSGWDERSKQAVSLFVDAGREEECRAGARRGVVTKRQRPQARENNGLLVLVTQRPQAASRNGIVRVDQSVAEVSNKQVVAEATELGRRHGHSPQRGARA